LIGCPDGAASGAWRNGTAGGALADGPSGGAGERGFTLLELIIAMALFGMIGLAVFGVIVLGATSAGKGERVVEQARRYRIANQVITRQVSSTECLHLPPQNEDDGLDDEESDSIPFFLGQAETLEFVTSAPQRPDASGLAIVEYWVEDGMLRMSERPIFTAYATGNELDRSLEEDSVTTTLLYDVESVTFSYLRESDSDEWFEVWDAADEEMLPATVRIDVRPSAIGGPDFYHEIPIMIGTFNQIVDEDEDCEKSRSRGGGGGRVREPEDPDDDPDEDPDDDPDEDPEEDPDE
jgi:prepilin-type N-terminal cleavage/methylation domain-containing protein